MQSFAIAPGVSKLIWIVPVVVALVLLLVGGILGVTLWSARTARFDVSSDGLRLRGDFYSRLIPAEQIERAHARRIDLDATSELVPVRRTMGTGMPGYQAGWFRLRNGERALLYLTDRSRAVYVPTTAGYSLILSPEGPDAFLSALRSMGR